MVFEPVVPSIILSQSLWYNSFIHIDKKPVYFKDFSKCNINFLSQLFLSNKLKTWNSLKEEFNLTDNMYFKWLQLTHAIPIRWKTNIFDNKDSITNLIVNDHHLIKKCRILLIEKATSSELYSIMLSKAKPTAMFYFENKFQRIDIEWPSIYLLPRKVTLDAYMRSFQYKILHNVLYLNKRLFQFGISNSKLCSFCNSFDETSIHIFSECVIVIAFWEKLRNHFKEDFLLPSLSPQTAIFGFFEENDNNILYNHLLLIFKLYIYRSRKTKLLNFNVLLAEVKNIKKIEKKLSFITDIRQAKFIEKWRITDEKIQVN